MKKSNYKISIIWMSVLLVITVIALTVHYRKQINTNDVKIATFSVVNLTGGHPQEQDDAALIDAVEVLYNNGWVALGWVFSGVGLELDESAVLDSTDDIERYVLIENLESIAELKKNCEAVFSKPLLEAMVYPYIDGEFKRFTQVVEREILSHKSTLYYDTNAVRSYPAFTPDFARAKLLEKSETMFSVSVPIVTLDDEQGVEFTFEVVEANEHWVLNSYYFGTMGQ